MTHTITRRAFMHRAALAAVAIPVAGRVGARSPVPLRIGVLPSATDGTGARGLGIQLGVDEAKHAAGLFGGSIELVPLTPESLSGQRLSAVLGGDSTDGCLSSAREAERAGIAFMNLTCPNDNLRGRDCNATTF